MNRKSWKARFSKRNSKKLKNVRRKSSIATANVPSENGSKTLSRKTLSEKCLFQSQCNKDGVSDPFSDIPSSSVDAPRFDDVLRDSSAPSLRRSHRSKSAPLAWWRNQRAVYNIGDFSLVRFDEGFQEKAVRNRKEQLSQLKAVEEEIKRNCVKNKHPIVEDVDGGTVFADVVCHANALTWSHVLDPASGLTSYLIAKSFDSKYLSFGFLEMLPLKKKNLQYTPEASIHYCILKGRVEFILNDSTFPLGLWDSFVVPQGNVYSITNTNTKNAVLAFCMIKSSATIG